MASQVAISLQGTEIIYFELDQMGQLLEIEKKEMSEDVSAMDIAPIPEGRQRCRFLAVGSYDQSMRIISLDPGDNLKILSTQVRGCLKSYELHTCVLNAVGMLALFSILADLKGLQAFKLHMLGLTQHLPVQPCTCHPCLDCSESDHKAYNQALPCCFHCMAFWKQIESYLPVGFSKTCCIKM